MSFQGKEFTQGMKQLVINLKNFYDTERAKNGKKANWAIEQTARVKNRRSYCSKDNG